MMILSQITFNDHDGHEMDIEYDEHIWTSPANAMKLVRSDYRNIKKRYPRRMPPILKKIKTAMKRTEGTGCDEFKDIVSNGRHRMIVVADKFPSGILPR